MKRILSLLVISLLVIHLDAAAQNRSITFIEKPWSEILAMAKEQDRMIFLDGFATWCGPCKWMAANMFTRDSVADYYNKTFICVHVDMEKGEGPGLANTYQVRAYPTLLFIKPDGEMVHKVVGAPQRVRDYLDMGNIALTPGEGYADCVKRFQEGERAPGFMMKYFSRLQGAYLPVTEPLGQYLATQKEADLTNRANWNIINAYLADIDSREFKYLVNHQKEFSKLYTRDSVNAKISGVFIQAISGLARSRTFSETQYNDLKQKIRNSGYEQADKVIFAGDLTLFQMKGQTDKFIGLAIDGTDKYYSDDYGMLNRLAQAFSYITTDKQHLEKAAVWARKSISLKSTPENNDTYANLMFLVGNKAEAAKYEAKAIELARKQNVPTKEFEDKLKKYQE